MSATVLNDDLQPLTKEPPSKHPVVLTQLTPAQAALPLQPSLPSPIPTDPPKDPAQDPKRPPSPTKNDPTKPALKEPPATAPANKPSPPALLPPSPSNQTSQPPSRSQTPTPSSSSQRRPRRRSSTASVSSLSSDDGTPSQLASPHLQQSPPPRPLPGHPANIYRNLLIMEDSFRQEYVTLRKTRRKYLLFTISMAALTLYFFYCVFIEPSIYRVIHFFNRLLLMIFATTIILFYISGSHRKTIGSSRKFIYNANKGMRGFNVKLVRIPQTWPETFVDWFWAPAYAGRPGSIVKLVLSARVFNPDIIEGWEIYRVEYWNKEYLKASGKPLPPDSSHKHRSSFASSTPRPSSSSLRSS